ncbi:MULTISPECIES: hypothetical protein [unclassified Sporosarcina]|uniref:hypothetical protein n=1 Tax=unclassified Sporosarcina TaxID=2647733 RepID=UPI00057A4811|nr:hypothetical protein [Sporosarcina sp. ZBG7A]
MKRWLLTALLVAVIIAIVWVLSEKTNSYSESQEALFEIDNDLSIIPGYKLNDKALFFFIKNEENLGAVYVQKRMFGWKVDTLTWSPMASKRNYDSDSLNGFQGHGENLIYGLIKQGDDRIVQVNEEQATILNLAMLPQDEIERFRLEGLYIWYFESEEPLTGGVIRLMNKNTDEELDNADF